MEYLSKVLDVFDMFGKQPKIFINGHQSYKSCYSITLSIFHHMLIVLFTIKVIFTLIDTQNSNITYSKENISSPPSFNLNKNTFPFAFTLVNKDYNIFIDEEIYQPLAYLVHRHYDNKQMKYQVIEEPINLGRCNKNNFNDHLLSTIKERNISQYYCLKEFNATIFGNQVSLAESSLVIYINECSSFAPVAFDQLCKSKEKIDEKLNEAYFSFLYEEYDLSLMDFFQPIKTHLGIDYTRISNFVNKEVMILYKQVSLLTDNNLFFFNENNDHWIQYDYTREILSMPKLTETILTARISLSNFVEKYKRVRIKGPFILSIIGGIIHFTNILFYLLSLLFTTSSMNLKLINSFFSFDLERINQPINKSLKSLNNQFNDSLQYMNNYINKESPSFSYINIQNKGQRDHNRTNQIFKKRLNHITLSFPIYVIELFKMIPRIMKKNYKKYDFYIKGQNYIQKRLDYVYLLNHFAFTKKAFNHIYDCDQQTLIGMKTYNNINSLYNDNDYDKNYNLIVDSKNKGINVISDNITKAYIRLSKRIEFSNDNSSNVLDRKILSDIYPLIVS